MPYMMIHFTKPWPEAARVHRGGIGSWQSRVEDEINLGRRLRPLRGRHHHGFAGALAQEPAALAALVSEQSPLLILARILGRSCRINCSSVLRQSPELAPSRPAAPRRCS